MCDIAIIYVSVNYTYRSTDMFWNVRLSLLLLIAVAHCITYRTLNRIKPDSNSLCNLKRWELSFIARQFTYFRYMIEYLAKTSVRYVLVKLARVRTCMLPSIIFMCVIYISDVLCVYQWVWLKVIAVHCAFKINIHICFIPWLSKCL